MRNFLNNLYKNLAYFCSEVFFFKILTYKNIKIKLTIIIRRNISIISCIIYDNRNFINI